MTMPSLYSVPPLAPSGGINPAPGNSRGANADPQRVRHDQPGSWPGLYSQLNPQPRFQFSSQLASPFNSQLSPEFNRPWPYPASAQSSASCLVPGAMSAQCPPGRPTDSYECVAGQTAGQAVAQPAVPARTSGPGHINLAAWQMMKIAAAVFTMRIGFHLAPKGLELLLKSSEKRLQLETDNRLLKFFVERVRAVSTFLTTRSQEHGSSLYKSLMAIVDGLMMLYVGGEVDRYFLKKNDNFKPKEVKDPEKVVDKVLLVLIATERMENLMHHFFHWLDPKPKSGMQLLYGELAALSAVLLDTTVKIASDRYRIKNNRDSHKQP